MSNSRSTTRANSWPAHAPSVQPGRLCEHRRRRHQHQQFLRAACPACTASPSATPRWPVTSATPFRSGPIAAPGGREANYALERAVEEAARITGIDRVRLRKKNLIPPSAMPFKTADRQHLRQRRFPRHRRTRRSSLPTSTISASADASRPSARNCAASACPACSSMPARCRWNRPRWRFRATTRSSSAATCSRPARATPRCSRACSPASSRHRCGQDPAPARRHRAGPHRLCLGRLALGHVRRQRHRITSPI